MSKKPEKPLRHFVPPPLVRGGAILGAATKVLHKLREAGFEALFAGGCVRDELIGRLPKDYDIATSATPKQVCSLFKRRVEIGAKFGVVAVIIGSEQVEVATFRTDSGYSDGRRPDAVAFSEPKEDALRRDFTVNGMFYDPVSDEVIDYVGGKADIEAKLIRTIGDADARFSEDFLRMLRAVRFSAELNFEIESRTWKAIKRLGKNIEKVSGERVAAELERLFECKNRDKGLEMLKSSSLAGYIFPEIADNFLDDGIKVLKYLQEPVPIEKGLAASFNSCGKEKTLRAIEPLKLSNRQTKAISWIFDAQTKLINPQMPFSKLRPLLADERFNLAFDLQRAVQLAANKPLDNLEIISTRAEKLKGIVLLPPPLLNGNEIIDLGAPKGPKIGELCKQLYDKQLDEIIKTKDQAITAVKRWLSR